MRASGSCMGGALADDLSMQRRLTMTAIKTWALNVLKATPAFALAHWSEIVCLGVGIFIGHKL